MNYDSGCLEVATNASVLQLDGDHSLPAGIWHGGDDDLPKGTWH